MSTSEVIACHECDLLQRMLPAAALIQLQSLATIRPGPGAVAFCSVVVLTMFAAMSFDPRLIWDPMRAKNG